MDPKAIALGNIRQLRGSLQCIDLAGTKNINSVLLLFRSTRSTSLIMDKQFLYRLDYALRGAIKDILRGRVVTQTKLDLKGLFKKKIEDMKWILPPERISEIYDPGLNIEGIPPRPGERWINGPHHTLVDKLNEDRDLQLKIVKYFKEKDVPKIKLTIFSDKWGESLRLSGNIWFKQEKMIDIYASQTYLEIVSKIFNHLKLVRRYFGGLTF